MMRLNCLSRANEEEGRKIFGMMVIDAEGQLVGMISMYDILVVGALAYPDIVGLLYQYCHDCEYNHLRQKNKSITDSIKRFFIKEIMTNEVKSVLKDDSLLQVMEELSVYRFGAILVKDRNNTPYGVISKTDLTLAYKHGVDSKTPAETIMSSPVQSCGADVLLEDAIKKMIFQTCTAYLYIN